MKLRTFSQIVLAATLVGVNLVACGSTKVAQCNSLSSEINKAASLGKKVEGVIQDLDAKRGKIKGIKDFHAMTKDSSEKVMSLVTDLGSLTTQVKNVELKDEKLVEYRNKTVTIYLGAAKSLKDVSEVLGQFTTWEANEEGKKMVQVSSAKLNAAAKNLRQEDQEAQMVAKEFNAYCGVVEKR